MTKKTSSFHTTSETHRLKGKRKGALLKEQVWFEDEEVVAYSLAYINLRRCAVDHGRVPGYDNSHDFHHRHFMGGVEAVEFTTHVERAEKLDRGESLSAEITISFEDPMELLSILTSERIWLLRRAKGGSLPISEIAEGLKRDIRAVSRDVVVLEKAGLLRTPIE